MFWRWCTLVVVVAALPAVAGCFDFSGQRRLKRTQLQADVARLQVIEKQLEQKFNQRDEMRSRLNQMTCEVEQLEQVIARGQP